MNLQQYLQQEGRVIFTTDVIYSHVNFDRRNNYSQRNKQLEMCFSDTSEEVENIIHSSTVSFADFRLLKSTVDSLDKIFKPITSALLAQFTNLYFELMLNDENTSIIENYLHFIACTRDGTSLTNKVIADIHNYLIELFSEINGLISQINKTTYTKDISSVILVSQDTNKVDNIKYKNRGASEFVHALFNSDLKNTDLATIIYMNSTTTKLSKPIIQDQKIFLDKPHVIYGTLEIESKTSRKIHVKGYYFDCNTVTNKPFSEMVFCKASGDKKEEYEKLFNYIDSDLHNKEVKSIIKPLQPYVCHEDVETKTKYLISVEEIE